MRHAPRLPLLPLLALAVACGGEADTPAQAATPDAPAQPAADAPAPPAAAPASTGGGGAKKATLPDVTAGLVTKACENGPGNEGADSHFTGEFRWSGDTVRGTERWLLHANEKWKKRGGSDCTITWHLSGNKVDAGACGYCDFGLRMTAEPDIEGSDCVEGLVKADAKRMELAYDVKLNSDGTAFLFFSKSGKRLGQGYHAGDTANWVSNHSCKWF